MAKLRLLWLIAIILQLPFFSQGQFSRQQAENLVLNQVLVNDLDHINVYSSLDLHSDPNGLTLFYNSTIPLPYTKNWVFLSDDNPFANWCHSCRYIMVDAENGDYSIENSNIFPADFDSGYELISEITIPNLPPADPCQTTNPTYLTDNPHLYAVLICGDKVFLNYTRDIATVYNTLRECGYPKANITVLFADGTANLWGGDFDNGGSSVINAAATYDNVNLTFQRLANILTPEDQLFVYASSDGFWETIPGPPHPVLLLYANPGIYGYTPDDMMNAVHPIQCAQMIFVMQQSFAGGFIDPILNDVSSSNCKNRIVITSCGGSSASNSHLERYITSGLISEFTFYWTAAIRGYYSSPTQPWKWECPVGTLPFTTWNPGIWGTMGHPADYNPDNGNPFQYGINSQGNADGYSQFIESYYYADCMDSYSSFGYHNPFYPGWDETPLYGINNGFSHDDLFCLNGIAGNTADNLTTAQTVDSRSYLLGGKLTVLSPMTLLDNVQFTMGVTNSKIDVQQNSQFTVNGINVKFKGTSNSTSNGLNIRNTSNILNLNNTSFIFAYLGYYGSGLNINYNSTFTNCPFISTYHGTVTIQNSTFNSSPLLLNDHDQSPSNYATVSSCLFTGIPPISGDGIYLQNYKNYSITNNNISGTTNDGIGLFYCGHGTGSQLIQSNTISNCGQSGLNIYYSDATVSLNHINNNRFGVKLYNNSNTSLNGNPNAITYDGTQEINDNSGIEIYASNNCFPFYMRYNGIVDGDNAGAPSDPLMYYDNLFIGGLPKFDVAYNCWGPGFDQAQDLMANYGVYKPYPMWCPNGLAFNGTTPDEDMYTSAENYVNDMNYVAAENLFKLLIETYPETDYARSAMKELFTIEPNAGNDFSSLRNYYLTNDSIMGDSTLMTLGAFLANRCNVQMENYPDAISWYEDKIQNPVLESDSIFAIIDLGNIYLAMDSTGDRPNYIGSLPQYKPESHLKFERYRDYLISLLPFLKTDDLQKKSLSILKAGQLLQNVPNPCSSSTDIYYKLKNAHNAIIRMYNSIGRLEQEISVTDLSDGIHGTPVDASRLSPGVYEYSLYIDGKMTDTKRMVVIK